MEEMQGNGAGPADRMDAVAERLKDIGHILVVISGKGGVGKSTVAVNLALGLIDDGHKVGLMDIDIHGPTVPKMLSIEKEQVGSSADGMEPIIHSSGLKVMSMGLLLPDPDVPVIWRGPKKMGAIRQFISDVLWGELDYLVVDLPPGTGDEPLSIAQLIRDAGAIIVTTPQDIALLQSRKAVTFSRALGLPVVGIVENMSGLDCPHCGGSIDLFGNGGGEKAAHEMDVPFLGRVPIDPQVVTSGETGDPFMNSSPDGPAATAFSGVVKKVLAHDWTAPPPAGG